jgi:hypothetical protein
MAHDPIEAVYDIIRTAPQWAAIGAEIYTGRDRVNPAKKSVVLHLVSGGDTLTQQGPIGMQQDLIRIYSRSDNRRDTHAIAGAIEAILTGFRGVVSDIDVNLIAHRNRNTDHEAEAEVQRQIDDYRIHYRRL